MAVSGGIKFFDKNLADSLTGATATATSGDSSAPFILDKNFYTFYRSVGSDDTITETLVITLAEAKTFNRLFLINHNFKDFDIKYLDGTFVDFANVIGVNGDTPGTIVETAYAADTSYYEFDSVTTNQIQIECLKTQVVDAQKFLNSFVVTNELGTLEGFPIIKDATKDKNSRKSELLNGRMFITKSLEVMRFTIDFKNYPPGLEDDLNLVYDLFDRDDSFFVWLCGGRNGDPFFKYQLRGFRLRDLIQVQVTNVFKDKYKNNLYNSMVSVRLKIEEAA